MLRFRFPGLLLLWLLSVTFAYAKELTFVTEQFPPFNYAIAGTSRGAGPMADVVMVVCEKIKARCNISVLPWRRALKMTENGEVDGAFSLLRTTERESAYFFSAMVMETAYSFFADETSTFKYSQPKDLDGFTIGVYGPSGTSMALDELLKSGTTGRVSIEIDNITVLKKLSAGRYGDEKTALAVLNRDVGMHLIKTEGIRGIKPTGDFRKIAYSIGFSRKKVSEAEFIEFNEALKTLIKEGTVKTILSKYGLKAAD